MNIYPFLVLTVSLLVPSRSHLCPPSCYPPKNINDCKVYVKKAGCLEDVSRLSTTSAHCGCFWQKYIESVNSKISDAQECLTWAVMACSQLDEKAGKNFWGNEHKKKKSAVVHGKVLLSSDTKQLADYVVKKILQMVHHNKNRKSHEIAKSRKRSGVSFDVPVTDTVADKPKGVIIIEEKKVPVVDILQVEHAVSNESVPKPPVVKSPPKEKPEETPKPSKSLVGHAVIGRIEKVTEPVPKGPLVQKSHTSKVVFRPPPEPNITIKDRVKDKLISDKPFREWMDFKVPADQFKLIVFVIILILNILVVLVLIFCRNNESYQSVIESKPMGDLNPDAYRDRTFNSQEDKTQRGWNVVYDKVRQTIHDHKERKRREENPFLVMEEINTDFSRSPSKYSKTSSPYVNLKLKQTPQRSSQKSSRGLYESIDDEDSCYLDNTYEEAPLSPALAPTPGKEQRKPYRSDNNNSEGSSPIKNFVQKDDKSISFALPPGAFITLQDRVDGVITEAEKNEGHGGIAGTSQDGNES